MKLEKLNDIANVITGTTKNIVGTEVSFVLDEHEHESLQQEVYKFINKTIHGYKSKRYFEIIISDVRFTFRKK
jgi:hypothetical protein